jgi:hypothetical protein
MVFRDESAGKTLEPRISQRMTVRRKKKKKKKRKRKRNNKKKEPVADEKLWNRKVFFLGCRIGKIIC